jgi:hypothetical protein
LGILTSAMRNEGSLELLWSSRWTWREMGASVGTRGRDIRRVDRALDHELSSLTAGLIEELKSRRRREHPRREKGR